MISFFQRLTRKNDSSVKPAASNAQLQRPEKDETKLEYIFSSSQSRLLHLPAEIRQQIWEECVGGLTIHIRRTNTSPIHTITTICRSKAPHKCDHLFGSEGCWGSGNPGLIHGEISKCFLLSLLLVSKQTHVETIHTLYQKGCLVTTSLLLMRNIFTVIPASRVDSIRSLRFKWMVNYLPISAPDNYRSRIGEQEKKSWLGIWGNISKMRGLKHLVVTLDVTSVIMWMDLSKPGLKELFEPLADVKINNFELLMPWDIDVKLLGQVFEELGVSCTPRRLWRTGGVTIACWGPIP